MACLIEIAMKKIILSGTLILCIAYCHAQGVGSIFDQGDSKIKLMLQQIALQQTYLSAIKTGYNDTQNGLNTAHDLKNGTYNLHQVYFTSLSNVSPAVANNPKIKLIATYQQQIITCFDKEIEWQKQQNILNRNEIDYIQSVYNNILSECSKDLTELNMVVTSGQVQMKDAERIDHIDQIYTKTSDKYKFSMSFTQNTHSFALDRQAGDQQMQSIKQLYNIK